MVSVVRVGHAVRMPKRQVPLPWKVWFGWVAVTGGSVLISVLVAAGRLDCGGWGFGCDPPFVAMMALYFLGPPLLAAGVVAAAATKWATRGTAAWIAGVAPPVVAAVCWSWAGVL